MALSPIKIGAQDVEHSAGAVTITSPELVNHLIQNQKEALGLLSTVAPVKLSEVSVDKMGRVVVANNAFATGLRTNLKTVGQRAMGNFCGAGC